MGGSGGGQGSGKVEYAAYIETAHSSLIGTIATPDTLNSILTTMFANSPYATAIAFNPDSQLAEMESLLDEFSTIVDNLLDETDITADVSSYAVILDDQINNTVKPRYEAYYRDIGAVQSSAFAIGLANIEVGRDRDVAKYASELKLRRRDLHTDASKNRLHYGIEVNRLHIAAKHDEEQRNVDLDVLDNGWDMDALLRGGQFLGSLGGGTHVPDKPSKLQSAIGGGLTGAAAGAAIGSVVPGIGTALGAGVGAALGAGQAFL